MRKSKNILIIVLVSLYACVEPYTPTIINSANNILVVEGTLQDTTTLSLSRTAGLGESAIVAEQGATVWVENSDQSYKIFLKETAAGQYTAWLDLHSNDTYRLGITTAGKSYYSAFVPVNDAPPISDVTWKIIEDGTVEVYVSSSNSDNATRYYRWNFTETWKYYAEYESVWKYENKAMSIINPSESVYRCYHTAASTNILIASTTLLSENVIHEFPLQNINVVTNDRIDDRYSILVRQYAITKEAFEFWQIMQKNTQNLGTLFGPQPSQLKSNIYNVSDASEPVIGFISAGGMTEKRIFIDNDDLPTHSRYERNPACKIDTVKNNPAALDQQFSAGIYLPITAVGFDIPVGFLYSLTECVDCRKAGGTLTKPSFWKD